MQSDPTSTFSYVYKISVWVFYGRIHHDGSSTMGRKFSMVAAPWSAKFSHGSAATMGPHFCYHGRKHHGRILLL